MLDNLRETITVLCSDAQVQLAYLDSTGVPCGIDELALELNDLLGVANSLATAGIISAKAHDAVRAIDQKFEQMSDDASLWTTEALTNTRQWDEIRRLANAALELFPPAPASP
jgi:hypothetical protein